MREELEEQRERYYSGVFLRVLWTSVVVSLVLGVLWGVAVALDWRRYVLLSAVGLLAGISVSVAAAGSARGRELTALVLGAVTFPLLAAHVAGIAAGSGTALDAYGAALAPFLAHASGAVAGGSLISRIWRGLPARPPAEAEEEPPRPSVAVATPAPEAPVRAAGGGG